MSFFVNEYWDHDPKFMQKCKGLRIAKIILKNKVRELMLPDVEDRQTGEISQWSRMTEYGVQK